MYAPLKKLVFLVLLATNPFINEKIILKKEKNMEVIITKENFEQEVLNCDIPVVVDFWATWCGPCMKLSPVIEELAKELDGKVKICKVNVDEQMHLAIKYRVELIPTLLFFVGGQLKQTKHGFMEKEEIKAVINDL